MAVPRTWVRMLAVDSLLSYEDPLDFTRWLRSRAKPVILPAQFRWAAVALFITALPALVFAATQLSDQPPLLHVPWFACSLLAGLWAFHEVPAHLRVSVSAFVTVGALATAGVAVAVGCATITALSSWASSLGGRKGLSGYLLLANWANLVLSAAGGAMVFDLALGLPGNSDFATRLATNRFLLAYPACAVCYVFINTTLASLASATRHRKSLIPTWRSSYSGVGMLFSIGTLQSLSFIIAFGSWGVLGAGTAGTGIAFLIILLLLGAGKQAVYHHEAREHISCVANLLRTVARPRHRKHPIAAYLLEDLLAQGTRRFLSGIPPEELTFEAEEAVFDAEIAWKLGASEEAIRSYLMVHETPEGTGPFGRKEAPLPVWSPSFPDGVRSSSSPNDGAGKPDWTTAVLGDLLGAAKPPPADSDGENRKWNRLALSGARTIYSMLERYDYGRHPNVEEDLHWWRSCELVGFASPSSEPEAYLKHDGPEPLGPSVRF